MATYLSKEKFEELKKKLQYLKTIRREEIAEKISEAKDYGDVSENAEFTAAKEEYASNEKEILELEDLLRNAIIIEEGKGSKNKKIVSIGDTLELKIKGQIYTYTIVGSEDIDLANNKISNESPIGKALLGKKVGDEVIVPLPENGQIKVKILKIK